MYRKACFYLLVCTLLVALLVPQLAGKGKEKTGTVEDNLYNDTRFGFTIQLPSDWKIGKLKKELNCQRLVAEKKNPRVPPRLRDDPSWATSPTLMIFADSSDLSPTQFFAFLRSDTTKSEFKKKINSTTVLFDPFSQDEPDILLQMTAKLGGLPALRMKARRQYEAQGVQLSGRGGITAVRDFVSGYIYVVKGEGWLAYLELVCENQFLPVLEETFTEITNSFGIPAPEPEDSTAEEPTEG